MKWICFSNYEYARGYKLTRDLGVMSLGLKSIGEDCQFIMFHGEEPSDDEQIITASREDTYSAEWWRQSGAQVVLMMAGTRRLDPIYRAIKEAGLGLVIRMDSDGNLSPRQSFLPFFTDSTIYYVDYLRWRYQLDAVWLGKALGACRTIACFALAKWFERRLAQRLGQADMVLTESPLSTSRIEQFFQTHGFTGSVVRCPPAVLLPAAAQNSFSKQKHIICIGEWWRYVKDAKQLVQTLARVLRRHPDYTATVIGGGDEKVRKLLSLDPLAPTDRITVVGKLPRHELDSYYAKSQILFAPSRREGFPNVAAEAASFGCSVVGWSGITAFNYFAYRAAGSASPYRTPEWFCATISSEITAWENGWRRSEEISRTFRQEFQPENAARTLVSLWRKGL